MFKELRNQVGRGVLEIHTRGSLRGTAAALTLGRTSVCWFWSVTGLDSLSILDLVLFALACSPIPTFLLSSFSSLLYPTRASLAGSPAP